MFQNIIFLNFAPFPLHSRNRVNDGYNAMRDGKTNTRIIKVKHTADRHRVGLD